MHTSFYRAQRGSMIMLYILPRCFVSSPASSDGQHTIDSMALCSIFAGTFGVPAPMLGRTVLLIAAIKIPYINSLKWN